MGRKQASNDRDAAGSGKGGGKDAGGKAPPADKKDGGKLKGAQKIKVRHILCDKHSKMLEALAKLEDEGCDWDSVVVSYSTEKTRSGGSLGVKSRADLEPEFANVAFALPVSTGAKAVYGQAKTAHGYHIIRVDERM